ncbi:cytochrome P450 [Virgisporangium aurantiacum]|uniref:Cytochrome P450 n=1 Tax=Virgisporangium aurantiacum TaxID=175570 RepID=A0A8J3ZAZ7_9ACTN|nr:cytochrome P450 [Virgisporangium aurantiacum]GIJ60467.1 cytochrome P450 [Virgisporangium aurantiacum]
MATSATDVDEVLSELLTPEGRRDLAGVFRRLHELGELHRSQFLGRFVTSYRNVDAVLRDPRVVRRRPARQDVLPAASEHSSRRLINATFMVQDPPDHTRIRRLVSKAFTPRAVVGLQPTIERILAERLDEIDARGDIDLMSDLAFPFPVAVIGHLIGVPEADQPPFQKLVRDLTDALDLAVSDADLGHADAAADTIVEYFTGLVAERRRRPADDLVSALIAVRDDGRSVAEGGDGSDRLTETELLATLVLLFLAGFETTTNLIGNGTYALLNHPAELDALRRDPALLPGAVEEMLRLDTPVQVIPRLTADDVTLPDGTVVPGDRHLLVLLGAANHDPRVFTDPGVLKLNRAEAATLSFGSGIHYCLGAGLARLEARLVFGALLHRFPSIELAETPQWRDGLTVRGLNRLRVTLRRA